MKRIVWIFISTLLLPASVFANQYWFIYSQNLQKEQKQLEKLPYIEPFVQEYLNSRIAMAQSLYRANAENELSHTNAVHTFQKVLTLCRNNNAINITKETLSTTNSAIPFSNNDIVIIHTELILKSFFNWLQKHPDVTIDSDSINNEILAQCKLPHTLSTSVRWHEIAALDTYLKQRSFIIASIETHSNTFLEDNTTIANQVLLLITHCENAFESNYSYTPTHTPQGNIVYQISIPQCFDHKKAINDITKIREAIVTEKNSQLLSKIQSIALSYINPVQEEIEKQDKLLATMKSIDGVAIENEEAYTAFVKYFEKQSNNLLHYAKLNELYCELMILQKPQIDYAARNKHIIDLASQLYAYVQSFGAHIKPIVPDIMSVIDILKAFIYVDRPDKDNTAVTATLNTLHTIKTQIQELSSQKNEILNASLCNKEVSLNIETLEEGIKLFNSQTFAKEALTRYSMVINQAINEAQREYSTPLVQKIVSMRSVIPFVMQFDVQKIMNEYSSQQYLLRKLRSDSASFMQRIESYKKKGISINDYEKAKEIVETIKSLQSLYTVDVGKYKMNQNNIVIIDKQCAAMLARMGKK
ncbi:MAG: hypothetical protein WHV26_03190 [Spirochaetota bacterium]